METKEIIEKIKEAVDNNLTMTVMYKYGFGNPIEVTFNPYIYGQDTMQYHFVWGLLTNNMLHYKMLIDFIVSVQVTKNKFAIEKNSIYLFAAEEEHYNCIKELQYPMNEPRILREGVHAGELLQFFEWKKANKIQ